MLSPNEFLTMAEKNLTNTGVPAARKYFYVLLVVVAAAFIFMLGYTMGGRQTEQAATGGTGKSAAYEQAVSDIKLKLQAAGYLAPLGETKSISGTVTAVGTDSLDIDANQLSTNPLEEPTPVKRHVTVGADTKIVKVEPLSPEESDAAMKNFMDEQKKYQAAMAAGKVATVVPPVPPVMETIIDIKLSDLAEGDTVIVGADQDIARAESFTATEVKLAARATTPIGAPSGAIEPPPVSGGPAGLMTPPPPPPPPPPTAPLPPPPAPLPPSTNSD